MSNKNKKILFVRRLFTWIIYLFSGFVLYSKESYLFPSLITFAKVIYPLSIFWLQIRIKSKINLLPIDNSMTTSQLWFNLLPVLASFITVSITLINFCIYIIDKLI